MGDRSAGAAGERGQASLELVAAVPALAIAALVAMQLLVAGYVLTLADGAAEAGAAALVAGREPEAAVRRALPGWERGLVATTVEGSRVEVTLRPPSPLGFLGDALAVSSAAWVRPPGRRR